jgi:hypothetical protein
MNNVIQIESGKAKRWAKRIAEAHAQSVEAIIRVGQLLIEAKAECDHGEWDEITGEATGKGLLPFSARSAQRYMAIARNIVLRNPTHVSDLPSSWGTLYELAKLEDEDLERYIADGRIHPEMTRADAIALREEADAATAPPQQPQCQPEPVSPPSKPKVIETRTAEEIRAETDAMLAEYEQRKAEGERREQAYKAEFEANPERQAERLYSLLSGYLELFMKLIEEEIAQNHAIYIPERRKEEFLARWRAVESFVKARLEELK